MKRVVIYRLGSLGDTVVALPCLHKVAQVYADAERIVLTNFPVSSKAAPLEAILGGSGLVHGFLAYPVGTRSVGELLAVRRSLRALKADALIYLTPSRGLAAAWRDWLFFRLCGIGHLIGVPLDDDLQHNRRGADGCIEQECARLARCVAELGPIDLADPDGWDLHLTAAEKQLAISALGAVAKVPRIAVNMGGKVAENDWGAANWRALMLRLREQCASHALVFVGAAEDAARAADAGALWRGPVVNLCGKVAPRVSAAALTGSSVFVGHDSGPLHLAASVGVTCVGLYGDKNEPRKWHPFGAQHRILHERRGVLAISVEDVAQTVLAAIGGAALPASASASASAMVTPVPSVTTPTSPPTTAGRPPAPAIKADGAPSAAADARRALR